MDLYKIVSQLTDEEFEEIHSTFLANNAEKSAAFLKIIRENPESPDKDFLDQYNIAASAFYVLKSRLNQKVEGFLLQRMGDPNLHVIHRVLNINDLVFNNTREISLAALRKLERELTRLDFPYGLMKVYKELQNLHVYDEDNYNFYRSHYNRQVAYSLAMDESLDHVIQFFKAFDNYYMIRKERYLTEMVRLMEKISNKNNLYESHRLYIFKSIIHLFGQLFLKIPDDIRCDLEPIESMFKNAFEILEEFKEDSFYKNISILFNFLRYIHYDNQGDPRTKIYYDLLNYKMEEMLTGYHYNVPTSLFLQRKLQYHLSNNSLGELKEEVEEYVGIIEMEPYRVARYLNFHMFSAYTYFFNKDYKRASRILYNLRNDLTLRKYTHVNLEVKFMLALSYVLMEDFDLANQLILSLQRQLRKNTMAHYVHGKALLKVMTVALSGKPRTRMKNLKNYIGRWNEENKGPYALLEMIDLEPLFLMDQEVPLPA
jgi:hypothetical protein